MFVPGSIRRRMTVTELNLILDCSSPTRLDRAVAERVEDLSRAAVIRLIEEGRVLLNGRSVSKSTMAVAGDEVTVSLPPAQPDEAQPQNIPLDIVYEDSHLLVVNKPKGMVVHPAAGNPDGTLVNALLYHCGDSLSGIGGVLRPGIVHRIDKDTSGLLIVAKNDAAHRGLAEQIQVHSFERTYEAVACGHLKEGKGTVCAPIGRHPVKRKQMAVVPQGGREATTHYTVLAEYPGFSHLRLRLETGRTHQIRVHMAHLGHPLAGDEVYGGKKMKGLEGQCLHARTIGFVHPATGECMSFTSDLPPYFCEILASLGGKL